MNGDEGRDTERRKERALRVAGRAEAVARVALLNRQRAVGELLRNAWTDAARAASLAVRRAGAKPRAESPEERNARARMAASGKKPGAIKKPGAGGVASGGIGGASVPPSHTAGGPSGGAGGGFRAPPDGAAAYEGVVCIFNGERYIVHGDALIRMGAVTEGPDTIPGTPSGRVYDADAPGAPLGYENMLLARLESAGINVGSARARLASQPRIPRNPVTRGSRAL